MNPEHPCMMCGAKTGGIYGGRPVCFSHYADGTLKEWLLMHPQGLDEPSCTWTEEEDGPWWTDCANVFALDDGDPAENGMQYCCFCGKRLKATSASHVL
jgi:hypothetical protein